MMRPNLGLLFGGLFGFLLACNPPGLTAQTAPGAGYDAGTTTAPVPDWRPSLTLMQADAEGFAASAVDPLRRQRSMRLSNRYMEMIDGSYRNVLTAGLRLPVDDHWALQIALPFVMTDQLTEEAGSGDLRIGADWVTRNDDDTGWLFGMDLVFDTSTEPTAGRGQHLFEPHVTWVAWRGKRLMVAPSYRHIFGTGGGDSGRLAGNDEYTVHEAILSLLLGMPVGREGKYWTAAIPELTWDIEGETQFFSLAMELGRMVSDESYLYLRPAVGTYSEDYGILGADYPYDWSLELGWRFTFR